MTENTKTTTAVSVVETTNESSNEFIVRYPIFLLFAEYLGYVSPLIDWAEDMCKGVDIPAYKKNILQMDAKHIFDKMMSECPKNEVHELYEDYYDLVFREFDEKLEKIEVSKKDDLPF